MKYIISFLLFICSLSVNAQGIEFFHGSWEEALVKAQEEEKLIFVDAYATWCGPCKRMAKNVFTDESVGEYYNQAYISLKMDMEKPDGRKFGQEYPVSAYPTLFYINEKGELLKKVVGGRDVEGFLAIGQEIAGSYDRSGDLAALYDEGNRDFELVMKYVKALNNANKSSLKVANDYLRENKTLSQEERAQFLYEAMTASDSRLFSLFVKDRKNIEKVIGAEKVEEKIKEACWKTIQNAIEFESQDLLTEAKEKMSSHLKNQAEEFGHFADYEFAKAQADIALLNNAALNIAKKAAKEDPEKLHDLCNELLHYKSVDESVMTSSEKIAKMAVDKSDSAQYLFTYSKILLANKKTKKALKSAKKALASTENPAEQKEIQEWIENIDTK